MANKRTAIVLGGSGSVGAALLRELFGDEGFDTVITLSRRSLPDVVAMARTAGRTLIETLVPDMAPGSLGAATLAAAADHGGDLEFGLELYAGGAGEDSCGGDSGGPLYVRLGNGELRLAGITSRGPQPCGAGGWYGVPYPALC